MKIKMMNTKMMKIKIMKAMNIAVKNTRANRFTTAEIIVVNTRVMKIIVNEPNQLPLIFLEEKVNPELQKISKIHEMRNNLMIIIQLNLIILLKKENILSNFQTNHQNLWKMQTF